MRRGLVAGYFHATPDLLTHAFAWTAAAGLIDLGVPPGFQESFAFATNGEHVVGMIAAGFEAGYAQHAFVWRASHGIVDIGTLNGSSRALDVNEQGAVVGDFVRPAGGAGTFLWTEAGGMRDVTPRSFTFGATPAGIDADGRIALQDNEDENGTTQSAVLVPRRR